MTINTEYSTNLTSKNNNIFIFVSNLSQLKNFNLHFNFQRYINNKGFINNFKNFRFININNYKTEFNSYVDITVYNINLSSDYIKELGADIFNNSKNIDHFTFLFSDLLIKRHKNLCSDIIFGFKLKSFNFDKYITLKKKNKKTLSLFKIKPYKELIYKDNLVQSINFCKNLVSEPANIINPITYSEKCLELKKIGIKVKILDKKQLEHIGMRSLLGVSQGSENDPRVIIFEWNLKKNVKPIVFVGKGVTFDTGGISLKPSAGMEEMITDMGGSAVVVGSMINAALNKSKKSLIGIVGLVENMPDGKAQRPGDIVTSLSGQTIEVLNTDAEGRLVLADLLTYIQNKYNPQQIIDFATLTGAIMIALGIHRAGIFSNNDTLANKLIHAGDISGEKLWRLPIGKEYDEEINSLRADMKNIGSTRYGGSIHAAQFIKRFIKNEVPWAHIDIAGVSWTMKPGQNSFSKLHSPGSTAFGIRLIDQFLKGR